MMQLIPHHDDFHYRVEPLQCPECPRRYVPTIASPEMCIACKKLSDYNNRMKPTFNKSRAMSWSSISSFEYDKEQWYRKYVLNHKDDPSKEMIFGKEFAESIEKGTCTYPGLMERLQKKKEHAFQVMFGKIPLIGYADAFCDEKFKNLDEVKTGKREWNQKRADEHGQIDMYLLMNYITNKVAPEDVTCTIHWCPTQDNGDFSITFVEPMEVKSFRTKRTMQQILAFGARINRVYKEMEDYCQNHV